MTDCHGCPCCVTARDEALDQHPESASDRRSFMLARERAIHTGEKQVASVGRILPHSRRRA
jgi:hypothetical protein